LSVVSSDSLHGEVYSLQHYVVKFVSDLRQVGGFLRVDMVSFTDKADRHYIAEIVLKVALSTLTLTLIPLTTIIKAYICIHRLLQNEVQQTLVKRGTHCKCRLGNSQCRLRNSQCRLGNSQCRLGNNQCRLRNNQCRLGNNQCRLGNSQCRLGNNQCRLRNSQCRLGNNQCRLGNNQWFCLFASKFNPFVGGKTFYVS
jgi:hypothetical protein